MASEVKNRVPEPRPLLPERSIPENWEGSRRVGRLDHRKESASTSQSERKKDDLRKRNKNLTSPLINLYIFKTRDTEPILMGETIPWTRNLLPKNPPPESEQPKEENPSVFLFFLDTTPAALIEKGSESLHGKWKGYNWCVRTIQKELTSDVNF